jgi:hypothetical protein
MMLRCAQRNRELILALDKITFFCPLVVKEDVKLISLALDQNIGHFLGART